MFQRWRLFVLMLLCASFARAESELDLNDLLARPGVRAVAVEFYADWCKPCQEAMPRWRELKRRYAKDGLRIVLINANDPDDPGKCKNLGWSPDVLVCDLDGALDQKFGVNGKLPSAFLWSWQRNLLVRGGHIGAIEGAVEQLFKELPRVVIETEGDVPAGLTDDVADALAYDGKVQVVASEVDRQKLLAMQLSQHKDASTDAESRCELGRLLAPNMRLVVSLGGKDPSLRLKLQNLETGCVLQQVKAAWDPKNAAGAARDATANLVGALRGPLEWPTGKVETAKPRAAAEASLGMLVVTSDVEGAEVSIDGRPQGVSIGRKETSFSLPPGRKQVKVSKSGYLDDLETVDLAAGRTSKVQAHLEAETKTASAPAPMEGGTTSFLTVTSEPKGAVITLDGKKVGKTPRSLDVAPGRHKVQLALEWYVDAQTEVNVAEGATQKVSLTLAPDFGEVEVATTPAQATVFLDGTQVGTTDPTLSLPRVTPGRHVLKVQKTDFHDVEQTIDVEAGKPLKVDVPKLKPSVGALRIVSEPAGANVELDKRRVGKTPVTVERLGAGAHAVKLTLDDHDDFEGSASVVEGTTREFSAMLESLMGTLSVTSVPAGQAVTVDGESNGMTPMKLTLREGEHRLRVGTAGTAYAVKEDRITVVRGQARKVDWTLDEQFGRLVVLTDPPEATVVLDGKEVGVSPLQLPKVAAGEHTLEARLKKHDPASQTVRVEPNKEAKVRLELAGYEQGEFDAASGDCPAGFVKIPAGTFTMGSENDPEADGDERPAHKVTLSAFCMAKTEVTQADWSRVMGDNPAYFKGDKRPVEPVSWDDAVAYCNKRSQREGLRAAYDSNGNRVAGANGYRLPTEAEWEYAARAGTKTPRYGELDAVAWHVGNSGGQTHDVGTKEANAWGLFDMLGNVWEWTGDWYADYGSEAQRDPRGPSSGSLRGLRGGGWCSVARGVRAAYRGSDTAVCRYDFLGLRPARSLP